jgi:hypothetical protein
MYETRSIGFEKKEGHRLYLYVYWFLMEASKILDDGVSHLE